MRLTFNHNQVPICTKLCKVASLTYTKFWFISQIFIEQYIAHFALPIAPKNTGGMVGNGATYTVISVNLFSQLRYGVQIVQITLSRFILSTGRVNSTRVIRVERDVLCEACR